jgi:3-hydroxybutyryl-CoA dehydratase
MMTGKALEELHIGDGAEFSKTISESDVYLYSGLTGAFNPVHIDESYAQQTFFKTRIAQGMLLGGFISAVLGTTFRGQGRSI